MFQLFLSSIILFNSVIKRKYKVYKDTKIELISSIICICLSIINIVILCILSSDIRYFKTLLVLEILLCIFWVLICIRRKHNIEITIYSVVNLIFSLLSYVLIFLSYIFLKTKEPTESIKIKEPTESIQELKDGRLKINELDNLLEKINNDNEELLVKINELENENNELKDENKRVTLSESNLKENEETIKLLEKSNEELLVKINKLENENNELKDGTLKINELENENTELKNENNELKNENNELKELNNKNEKLENEMNILKNENTELNKIKDSVESTESRIAIKEEHNEKLLAKINKYEKDEKESETDFTRISKKWESAQTKVNEKNEELKELKKQLAKLKKELTQVKQTVLNNEAKVANYGIIKTQILVNENKIKKLEYNIDKIKKNFSAYMRIVRQTCISHKMGTLVEEVDKKYSEQFTNQND